MKIEGIVQYVNGPRLGLDIHGPIYVVEEDVAKDLLGKKIKAIVKPIRHGEIIIRHKIIEIIEAEALHHG